MVGRRLTFGAVTQELVDLVHAAAIVQTGTAGTLVSVDLTVYTLITCGREMVRQRMAPAGPSRAPAEDSGEK